MKAALALAAALLMAPWAWAAEEGAAAEGATAPEEAGAAEQAPPADETPAQSAAETPAAVAEDGPVEAAAVPLEGEKRYISDVLYVPLRTGPANTFRILHWGLQSGTELTALRTDEASGFSQVRTAAGRVGWLRTQYLVDEPIARQRLEAAQAEAGQLSAQIAEHQQALSEAEARNAGLTDRNESLAAELEELKALFESDIDVHAANKELTEANAELQEKLDERTARQGDPRQHVEQQWMLIGAGLLLVGLLLGVAIKSRPRRDAWS